MLIEEEIKTVKLKSLKSGEVDITLKGGSENNQFIELNSIYFNKEILENYNKPIKVDSIILSINNVAVSGYTLDDAKIILEKAQTDFITFDVIPYEIRYQYKNQFNNLKQFLESVYSKNSVSQKIKLEILCNLQQYNVTCIF